MIYDRKMARDEHPPRKHTAPALDKGLDILELLATRGVPLTCPYIETPKALPIKQTIAAIREAADEISAKLTQPAAV